MLKVRSGLIRPLVIAISASAALVAPQLALAQAPGALVQLAGSNACLQATNVSGGDCPNSTAQETRPPGTPTPQESRAR